MFTLAFRTSRYLIGFRKANHFFETFSTLNTLVFVNRHGIITSQTKNILYPSIAYFYYLSRIIKDLESTKPACLSLLALLGTNNKQQRTGAQLLRLSVFLLCSWLYKVGWKIGVVLLPEKLPQEVIPGMDSQQGVNHQWQNCRSRVDQVTWLPARVKFFLEIV